MVFRKQKKLTSLDNLKEIILIAQECYEMKWDQKISVEKVRFLYDFLFEQIIHTVEQGVRFNIYDIGSFNRAYVPPRISTNLHGQKCAIPPHYKIYFKTGRGLKERINRPLTGAKDEAVNNVTYDWKKENQI